MKAPVQLVNYRIKKLNYEIIKDFSDYDSENALYAIDIDYDIYSNDEDPSRFKVDLFLKIIPSVEEEVHLPYEVEIILEGLFLFEQELEDEEKGYHLNISCTSMLYGAARNIIHQLTGESNYGAISIPAIQFAKVAEEKRKEEVENSNTTDPVE
jgi:preprotein translocase subunit SecB